MRIAAGMPVHIGHPDHARVIGIGATVLASLATLIIGTGHEAAAALPHRHHPLEAKQEAPVAIKGPLEIVVSIGDQRVTLYSGNDMVARSSVSTGMPGHPTPLGVFSVLQKHKWHRSNIYSAAPMPYMQRITWSGVALHAGVLPGYPASHGCIRLTYDFAKLLWRTTKLHARVFVVHREVAPVEFSHASLFVPKPETPVSPQPEQAAHEPDGAGTTDPSLPTAAISTVENQTAGDTTSTADDATEPTKITNALRPSLSDKRPLAVSSDAPVNDQKKGEPISVFISRKEAKLFVRRGFAPLFEVPVVIREPDLPLGTHVLTAGELQDDGRSFHWYNVSLPTETRRSEPAHRHGRHVAADDRRKSEVEEEPAPVTAAAALDRIEIPKDVTDRISEMMTPGSSLIISDHGLGSETGEDTDFIVLSH